MKYSITLATFTLGLVATACGGFTDVGQGGALTGGTGATSGTANQGGATNAGGSKPSGGSTGTGGATNAGGVTNTGGATSAGGDQGTANAPSTGGAAGSGGTGQSCKTDSECPRSLAACQLCEDGTSACPWARCENGTCKSGIDRCPTGTPTCKTDTDCPAVEMCSPCADGNCAQQRCMNGACQLSCDAGGGATCSAELASCAHGETCCAGLECCAGVPVPAGNEYCGKVCPKSDVNIKRDFMSVDPNQILDKLSRLPVGIWSYRTEGSSERHIGPMAQDFKAAFGVGASDRTILQVDADGVSFAAIQALNLRLTALEEQNQKLQRKLDEQQRRCPR